MTRTLHTLASTALLAALAGTLSACDAESRRDLQAFTSDAEAKVEGLASTGDVSVANGEPDYGVKVTFNVTNVGRPGLVKISTWLSSSEGEWTREQRLHFESGETRALTYFFTEPTIDATNIQYGVTVLPKVKDK